MIEQNNASWPVSIFMAGNVAKATELCRAYCDEIGFCVTVTPTAYVYTGGQEAGFIVGLINYPRFPSEPSAITARAVEIGDRLRPSQREVRDHRKELESARDAIDAQLRKLRPAA